MEINKVTEERNLLFALTKGKREAFDVLFKRYYPMLCAYARRIVEQEDTEEIVIDAPEECAMEEEEEVIFMVVESMPEFPGGQDSLFSYLEANVQYPVIAQENGIQGRVICQFVVNKDGSIVDVVVVRSSGEASLDKEAQRVIGSMPKWKPGKQRGKPVRVKYTLPVNFRLQ